MISQISFVICALLVLSSCQNLQTRHQAPTKVHATVREESPVVFAPVPEVSPVSTTETTSKEIQPQIVLNAGSQVSVPVPEIPKIGLILGPGGARTFAHIGFLQELQREKIPIHSIGGLEFAAPMAALFAWKGFANDVEWQMMKLKTEPFQKKWVDSSSTSSFLNTIFQKSKVEELKLPFACPAHNLSKNQIFVMSRGLLQQLVPYCWPYPPVMKPHNSNVAGLRDAKPLADYLRSQGANYIVYVDVLAGSVAPLIGERESFENVAWQEIATSVAKNPNGIDYVVHLNVDNYGILEFDKKRDILQKGTENSVKAVQQLARKLNL